MTAVFNSRTAGWVLLAMAALACSSARSADRLYYFVDEQGVSHFSNVPVDRRYRPLASTGAPAAAQINMASVPAAPAVEEATPRTAGPAVPLPDAANAFPEPDTAEPLPEDMVLQEMFADDTFAPPIEVEPPGSEGEPATAEPR